VLAIAGCGDTGEPSSQLAPEGPPKVLQVLARERVPDVDDDGNPIIVLKPHLAFGDHADIDGDDDRQVTAAAARTGQRIRVVVDELLRGNELVEIRCADDSWSRVPLGTTPGDIANCSGPDLRACKGSHAVCMSGGTAVGIRDEDQDGNFDDIRMIAGVASLVCGDRTIEVDQERSFYQPSGSQLIPAGSNGPEGLGPAVVLVAADGLPPGATCGVRFASSVTDKDGVAICASPGDGECVPGNTDAVQFTVEPFLVAGSEPADGAVDVALLAEDSTDATVRVELNASLVADSLTGVAITAGGVAVDGATVALDPEDAGVIVVTVPGGFQGATEYAVAVPAGVADGFGDSLAEAKTITFTTRAASGRR
jgi:hypothetical protein